MEGDALRSSGGTSADATIQLVASLDVLAAIREHVEATYPEEAPGGLLGIVHDENTIEVVEAAVSANARDEERRRRYLIGPDDVVALERRASQTGLQVVGYYHSHPDAPPAPSDFDREHAWPWYVYLIVSVVAGRAADARAWRLSDDRQAFDVVTINDRRLVTIGTEGS
jgi:proteasome lid subunit RPN8/RPN11